MSSTNDVPLPEASELTGFTRPLTGAYYLIPSSDALAALGSDDRAGAEAD